MTYFKIIQNGNVISVGCVFLKWNETKKKMHVCNVDEGQFVQSYDEQYIYKASWLKPAPKKAGKFPSADVEIIDQTEYEDIKALLEENEPVVVEQEIEPVQAEQHEEPQEEKPLTIAEMRKIISEQQEQIKMLMKQFDK